jgi:hypothetical protein
MASQVRRGRPVKVHAGALTGAEKQSMLHYPQTGLSIDCLLLAEHRQLH